MGRRITDVSAWLWAGLENAVERSLCRAPEATEPARGGHVALNDRSEAMVPRASPPVASAFGVQMSTDAAE